jgi:hypothetical protein
MPQQIAERGQAFELPEPAPSDYHPNYTLAEQLQYDARAQGQLTDEQTAAVTGLARRVLTLAGGRGLSPAR